MKVDKDEEIRWPCTNARCPEIGIDENGDAYLHIFGEDGELIFPTDNIANNGWISVSDYLPDNNVAVLVFDTKEPTGTRHIKIDHVISVGGQEKYYGRDRIWASEYGNTTKRIAYWMPLPEGPERDEKEIREWQT